MKRFWYKVYSRKEIDKINKKLSMINDKISVITFLNLRTFTSIIMFFMIIYIFDWGYILSPVVTFIYFHLFTYIFIDLPIKKREEDLEFEAINFFEIMALSLESGKTIKDSIVLAVNNTSGYLTNEFRTMLKELDYGKGVNEALKSLRERIPSDLVSNIILHIEETDKLGNEIVQDIYNQIDYIRDREVARTKSIINKIPVKVSIISVLFYIPLITLLILMPVIIKFIN